MPIIFSGSCICGAVRYECTAAPLAMYNCHCHVCQRAGGAAFSSIVVAAADAVTINGSPSDYSANAAGSSDHAQCGFCRTCGSPLFARSETRPDILIIRATSLTDSNWFKPIADIWTVCAQPWTVMDTHIPKVYRSPPLFRKEDMVDV